MERPPLTTEELAFLDKHELSADDIIIGSRCKKADHRLRTRGGHCAQCNTKMIAYWKRHHSPGYVYIVGSSSARLLKIGVTKNIEQRKLTLAQSTYGGADDWEMLFYTKVKNAGEVEQRAQRSLKDFQIVKTYKKEGSDQKAQELFETSFGKAIKAVSDAIGVADNENAWLSDFWSEFDY
jgi:hypothetical protein